jgi:8-oxo-dGTP diphosphatase
MRRFVVGFAFSADRERVVLVEKASKPGEEWQAGLLNGVGGKVEGNETPYEAMSREYYEEAGVLDYGWDYYALWKATNFELYFFRLSSDEVYTRSRTMESEPIRKEYVYELPHLKVVPNLKFLIPLALNADAAFTTITSRHGNPAFK